MSDQIRPGGRRRLPFWLALAALVHAELLLLAGVLLYLNQDAPSPSAGKPAEDPVEFALLDEDLARRLLAEQERDDERRREEARKKEEESARAPGQVVEIAEPKRQEHPDEARFAAEYDSTVAEETKKVGPLQASPRAEAPAAASSRSPARVAARVKQAPGSAPGSSRPSRSLPALLGNDVPAGQDNEAEPGSPQKPSLLVPLGRLSLAPMGDAADAHQAGAGPLVPSETQLAEALGSGTSDHLKGVAEGDDTALNAKKWKHAAFFNRVKRQVREHWNPGEAYRQRDPTFRIYGQADRYTLLKVSLKPDGSLAEVALETPSGVDFLDDEAIEAFKQAQPFPNPPRQLIEEGQISFRFGFYFEIGGAPRMKVFRYDQM